MMQAEPGIPQSCSIFPGRAPQPPRPSRRWGAGAALVVLVAVLGIATPEDAQAQVTLPGAPRHLRVSANSERVILNWSVPADNVGAGITDIRFQYRYAVGDTVPTSTIWSDPKNSSGVNAQGAKVKGLTTVPGTQYTFEVRAVNSAGAGPAATLTATTERLPIELSWDEQTAGLDLSFTVTITFSEAVTGFTLDDISVQGSYPRGAGRGGDFPISWPTEKANFQAISATTYSVDVMTPTPQYVSKISQVVRADSVFFLIGDNAVRTAVGNTPNVQKSQSIGLKTSGDAPSTDATLSALKLSNASNNSPIRLSPSFVSIATSYTALVPNGVERITIAPTRTNNSASVEYLNSSDTPIPDADTAKDGHQVPLDVVGENTIKVKVTAADTTPRTYTVVVTRDVPDSTDATLRSLVLSSNGSSFPLTPSFASSTMSYTASVDNGVDEITITPTVNESNATVEYQNSSDTDITDADTAKSGHQVPLDVGENTIKVKVKAEDRSTTRTYTVVVTRAVPDSTDATLRSLELSSNGSDITLTPSFASSTMSYTASVASSVAQITIAPTTNSSSAGVEYFDSIDVAIDDADADAMNGHQVPLGVGENTIKVKVTSEDDTTLTYTVTVTRPSPMSDATLSALALSNASNNSPIALRPAFAPSITSYTASVPNGVAQITIVATPTIVGASVEYLDNSDTAIRRRRRDERPSGVAQGWREHDQGEGHGRGHHHDGDLHRDGDPCLGRRRGRRGRWWRRGRRGRECGQGQRRGRGRFQPGRARRHASPGDPRHPGPHPDRIRAGADQHGRRCGLLQR